MEKYAENNGTIHYKNININGKDVKVKDYYEPNDPDEYVMCIVDHLSILESEKREGRYLQLRECMGLLTSQYFVKLRNVYNYIPIAVQQQAAGSVGLDNMKANKLKPSVAELADNRTTARDFNVILGLHSPFAYEVPEYLGYDITFFKDNIRFMEILASREGGAGTICPLYFDGAVNYFRELPLPNDINNIKSVYKFIENMRNEG